MKKKAPTPPQATSDPATEYASNVIAGLILAGPDVRAACARHLDDLKYGASRGLVWDLAASNRSINFFPDVLRLNGGEFEGKPFKLLGWQQFIIGSLFGWMRADGSRRFREAYVEAGKGSGKSPLAAGIGLYMLVADNEARAEVYAAATSRDQAMVLFRDAVAMVDLSPELARRISKSGKDDRVWNLAYPAKGSFFRPIASDDKGQSGRRPHCALIDEVHEHKNRTVIDFMQAGKKGRRQPLIFMITNSGFDRTSICFERHEYGGKIANRTIEDDAFFAFICSQDEGEDPFEDESCWMKTNPSLGETIQPTYLREQIHLAKGMPSQESTVRRLNFCQWVDAANPWIDGDLWRACEVTDLAIEDFADRVVHGGLDLSGTRDLTALAIAARNGDDSVDAFVNFFTPEETMTERERLDFVQYSAWVKAGHVIATPGRAVDYGTVADRLATLEALMRIAGVAFDPYRIKYFERELDAIGLSVPLVPHGQGFARAAESNLWMCRSIEVTEKLVLDGKLRVKFNPCLRWNSASAVIESDAKSNRIFTKRKSTGRIDGMVALVMAIGLAFNEAETENLDDFLNAPLTV